MIDNRVKDETLWTVPVELFEWNGTLSIREVISKKTIFVFWRSELDNKEYWHKKKMIEKIGPALVAMMNAVKTDSALPEMEVTMEPELHGIEEIMHGVIEGKKEPKIKEITEKSVKSKDEGGNEVKTLGSSVKKRGNPAWFKGMKSPNEGRFLDSYKRKG